MNDYPFRSSKVSFRDFYTLCKMLEDSEQLGLTSNPHVQVFFAYHREFKPVTYHGFVICDNEDILRQFNITMDDLQSRYKTCTTIDELLGDLEPKQIKYHGYVFNSWDDICALQGLTKQQLFNILTLYRTRVYIFRVLAPKVQREYERIESTFNGYTYDYYKKAKKQEIVDKVLSKIKIRFNTYAGNKSKWFDYIDAEINLVCLTLLTKEQKIKVLTRVQDTLQDTVRQEIYKQKKFIDVGITGNFLVCDNCTLTNQDVLMYKFSIAGDILQES